MKRKIALLITVILVISLFGGCSGNKVNVTLDEIIEANSYASLIKEYGVYKLEYNYGSKDENFIEYVSDDGVMKLINNKSTYIYFGEKCCYYKCDDEIYALLKDYDDGKTYRDMGNIFEGIDEADKKELKKIEKTDDGYVAVCVVNGEAYEIDGQVLTADDEIRYTMTLNENLTVTALTATVKYGIITETDEYPEGASAVVTEATTADVTETAAEKKEETSSTTFVNLQEEENNSENLGYERRLYSLTFEDSVDGDYAVFEPYVTLKNHASPDSENTVSVNVFSSDDANGKTYYCTKGDKMYVSDSGYYKDETHNDFCSDNFVTVLENVKIYL